MVMLAVNDSDDVDDETFNMDDGMQLIVYTFSHGWGIAVSLQELLQCSEASGQMSSNPFPSHLFALLFFLIHSPHPLVCGLSDTAMWHVCPIIQGTNFFLVYSEDSRPCCA